MCIPLSTPARPASHLQCELLARMGGGHSEPSLTAAWPSLLTASGEDKSPGRTTTLRCSRAELQDLDSPSPQATCWGALPTPRGSLEGRPLSSLSSGRPSVWMPSRQAISHRLLAGQVSEPGPGACARRRLATAWHPGNSAPSP